jgi:hypothetical protein
LAAVVTATKYRHGDSKPRHSPVAEPSLAVALGRCAALDRCEPLGY